ncbi:hypothetical protein SAMN05443575_1297 [Jatrophihabitans endophyticus]|uniref:Flagellar basal body-associated protein FliL n=1 Tax=Jatrophihabitans endophyticus TaxID=1206085 RepID=A0A1M5GUD7_9ACTN|nr:hypothetical protein [Jatrophihabitans endophyticus]SHG07366.1 hypothetical protein SAMN05443575_1297 [Jatrophihabitans endophyticus]
MTNPYDPQHGPGQPQYGQPQYGQPQYGQPQYGQPQYGQPQYGQPQYGQPQYGQPQYGHPGQDEYLRGPGNTPPGERKRHGKLVAASAAVVVLAGGGVATYVAVSSSGGGGTDTPRAAVEKIVTDLDNDDLVGVLEDLPPGERAAITKPFLDTVDQLKRTKVLRSDADLSNVSGVDVHATDLRYADKTVVINDDVQIVQVTGGRFGINADAAKLPLTADFVKAIGGTPSNGRTSESVDISDAVRRNGKPVRIATQKVDGKWYPSLTYTIADAAAADSGKGAPGAADRIPAVGADSADAAVRKVVDALLKGDVRSAIEVVSPDELGALHDYGTLVVDKTHYDPVQARIDDIQFADQKDADGTRVTLKSLDLTTDEGQVRVAVDGDCVSVTVDGDTKQFCASDVVDMLQQRGFGLTRAQAQAVARVYAGLGQDVGIETTQVDGSWYVNPLRTYTRLGATVLSKLQGNDLLELIGLVND